MAAQHASAATSGAGEIQVAGVRHVYKGGTVALDGIDLRVGTGLFGLLGPNGAGKSTLMRILCTLLVPTQGSATVCGHDVVHERLAVRRRLGYLPQEFGAWRLQRVGEVLDTLQRMSGVSDKNQRRRRCAEVLEQVGLDEMADRKVKKLSGGMVRRLGVAQALIHDPQVIVVDEPTVGLDPQERLRFRRLMADLGQQRIIVLSTHIVGDLGSGCRDLALIDRGSIEFRGSPQQLVQQAGGRTFEMTLPIGGEAKLAADVEIVSRTKDGVGIKVRGVSGGDSRPAGATPVESPTLEEAYVAFMARRGRANAALVETGDTAAESSGQEEDR